MNRYHEKVLHALDRATAGMTEDQLCARRGEKWSVAQILEHLGIAFGHTARVMKKCLEAGKPLGDPPTWKQRAISMLVVDIGYFPEGRQAPKMVVPSGTIGGADALKLIRGNLMEMDRLHAECMERVGRKGYLANHPVLGPLTITQWPKFHWIHTRHHMKQVEQIKNCK